MRVASHKSFTRNKLCGLDPVFQYRRYVLVNRSALNAWGTLDSYDKAFLLAN